jgi:hypothetical protein
MTTRTSLRAIAAIVIGSAALVYMLNGSGPAHSAQRAPTLAEKRAIAHVGAFRRAASAKDEVPGETMLSGTVRRVGAASAAEPLWASIEPEQDCVQIGANGASACASPERLEQEPLIVGAYRGGAMELSADAPPPPPEEWAGLTADDVESIGVAYEDGATEEIAVVENGFYLDTNGRVAESFSWTIGGTVHTYPEG